MIVPRYDARYCSSQDSVPILRLFEQEQGERQARLFAAGKVRDLLVVFIVEEGHAGEDPADLALIGIASFAFVLFAQGVHAVDELRLLLAGGLRDAVRQIG